MIPSCRWYHPYGRKRRRIKGPLDEGKKTGLKLNIQKTKIMASSPITSWQIDGETMETVTDFIFVGSKITVDNDCSHEIKRRLLLGRKAMTSLSSVQLLSCLTLCDPMNRSTPGFPVHHLDSILKSRDITLPAKVCLVKNMVFPVVMYGCETWTIKKAECHHNWCFWTMVLEKTVESLGLQGDPTSQS